ncbi:hypothetical protein F5B20DRAFT_320009 [Whalleya microplaca]|nr:hypothetical protein F5B20DRAFT_320009 [Whalleya microplaca]
MDWIDFDAGSDADANVNLDLNSDINTLINSDLITSDGGLASLEPSFDFDSSNAPVSENSASSSKPYHAKRPHKKSRAGCMQCKRRKVKCDEARPACKACTLRKETCVYPNASASASSNANANTAANSPASAASTRDSRELTVPSRGSSPWHETNVTSELLYRPSQAADTIDMKMLWFYTAYTFQCFSIESGHSHVVDHALQVKVVEHAFQSPFLMHCLMALSSLHLQSLNQPISPKRAAAYRARAFEGYRDAIERAEPTDFPALIACSLLMTALSSQMFREPDGKPLYIIDWMQVWRGIGLIIDIVSPQAMHDSGLAVLFYRPPVDLEKSATHIPNNLLFMVTSIGPGDSDYEHQQTYYDTLKYLGSLYGEIKEHGFSPIMDLRIVTFFTFTPKPFIPLAKEFRPRALVIIAHFLCFAKLMNKGVWWMRGIADREIPQIIQEVGDQWAHLLRVPRMVLEVDDRLEIAKVIIDNFNWTPKEIDNYEKNQDPRVKTDLKLIDNTGAEYEVYQGQWRYKKTGATVNRNDRDMDSHILFPFVDRRFVSKSSNSTATTPSSSASAQEASTP